MYTTDFDYAKATTVDEALSLMNEHGSGAKLLAGGHSLMPTMKLRLAQPSALIDINPLSKELAYVREDGDRIRIGALTTHRTLEQSDLLKRRCRALSEMASKIGDPQVRNRGTIGGSLAHADPAADYPAMMLALNAEITIRGASGSRTVGVDDFFTGMFETAVGENELLTEVTVPVIGPGQGASYAKFANPASRYAVVGVAAKVQVSGGRCTSARIGVTGAAPSAFRATDAEEAVVGTALDGDAIAQAVGGMVDTSNMMEDLSGSPEYRAHLCETMAKRAISQAAEEAKG
jgi:carbon-monoxide dehydrogenase medium subunit